jgi:hypothetical protein
MNGKGSARRGTSKEEMKRFADNYDAIFKKKPKKEKVIEEPTETCSMCETPADWVRCTQFAGNHFYCDLHAKLEKDFGKDDSSYFFWHKIKE